MKYSFSVKELHDLYEELDMLLDVLDDYSIQSGFPEVVEKAKHLCYGLGNGIEVEVQ